MALMRRCSALRSVGSTPAFIAPLIHKLRKGFLRSTADYEDPADYNRIIIHDIGQAPANPRSLRSPAKSPLAQADSIRL